MSSAIRPPIDAAIPSHFPLKKSQRFEIYLPKFGNCRKMTDPAITVDGKKLKLAVRL